MRMDLSALPTPPREYTVDFPRLDGGLNTRELDYRLDRNESPDMVNLWWRDGVLCSRQGQVCLARGAGPGRSACEQLRWDNAFFHMGDSLYRLELTQPHSAPEGSLTPVLLLSGAGESAGSWFSFGDGLYYKNRGGYYRITHGEEGFSAGAVEGYSPIIQINTDPTTAAGDAYQPENRICPQKTVWYSTVSGVREYHLPVQNADSVDRVVVDGVELTEGFAVDLAAGTVTFHTEPTHHDPFEANTVRITYTKANADAMASVMDCTCAQVYGGERDLCVVMGGCTAQPNAYFWSGSHIVMDPTYFPMEQYNLAGETGEAITAFGRQQNMLVIFKEHSVGRAALSSVETDSGRVLLTLDYTAINSAVGCDLPRTVRLVENNLVFCSSRLGVCRISDSSAAYENNILPISRKVDRELLAAVAEGTGVCAHDDGGRYWLAANGRVWLWDYALSTPSRPVWFYFEDVPAAAFFSAGDVTCHLDGEGRVSALRDCYQDYGGPILKRYRFAGQTMGGYDRLKDVLSCIFVVRGAGDSVIHITYHTDHETRRDLTPIRSLSHRLAPRNLACRCLGVRRFATVARRRPGCRHVRHFSVTLENGETGMDMAVISAQVFYRLRSRER